MVAGDKRFSEFDLVNYSACSYLTNLDLVNMVTSLPKSEDSDEIVLIRDKGIAPPRVTYFTRALPKSTHCHSP